MKISYCIFKIVIKNEEKNYKFLNLCCLSTESFLAIWPSQYKFLINEFLIKECVNNYPLWHHAFGLLSWKSRFPFGWPGRL